MAAGKAAWTKARPTSAGLNGLCPSPPNSDLPNQIAVNPATAAIHSGNAGGRVSASSTPVMVALQSDRVFTVPERRLAMRSAARQDRVTVTISAMADSPYCQTEKAQTGSSAYTTWRMMVGTSRPLCTWGEARTSRER